MSATSGNICGVAKERLESPQEGTVVARRYLTMFSFKISIGQSNIELIVIFVGLILMSIDGKSLVKNVLSLIFDMNKNRSLSYLMVSKIAVKGCRKRAYSRE